MTFQYFIPDENVAIEFEKENDYTLLGRKRLITKADLCEKNGIIFIRIGMALENIGCVNVRVRDESAAAMVEAVGRVVRGMKGKI